jgi:hypothetical protein
MKKRIGYAWAFTRVLFLLVVVWSPANFLEDFLADVQQWCERKCEQIAAPHREA